MTDLDVRHAVLEALEAAPEVDCATVGVTVHNRVVTLTGRLDSFAAKAAASRIALRAEGVLGVANEIEVCGSGESYVSDEVIAAQIVDYLGKAARRSRMNVRVSVSHGDVTLTGAVDHESDRIGLYAFARGLQGVECLHDRVMVRDAGAA